MDHPTVSPRYQYIPNQTSTPHNATGKPKFIPGLKSYVTMLGLLGVAIATAFGQHAYYNYLNDSEVSAIPFSQSWAIRIGNAFAFLFKTCLVSAVGVAFCQGFWYSVRRNAIRLGGLDSMFGVLQNPFNLFDGDLLLRNKRLVVLALICWLLPISAIFSPGALTVLPQPLTTVANRTVPILGPLDTDVGFIEIGTATSLLGATQQLRRIAAQVLTGGAIIAWPSPCGSNCSYTVSFIGPAYQCQRLDSLPVSVNESISNGTAGIDPWIFLAEGRYQGTFSSIWGGSLDTQGLWVVRALANQDLVTLCQLFESTYTLTIQYSENIPTFVASIVFGTQIPGSAAEVTQRYDTIHLNQTEWTLINLFAIEEAVAEVISGSVTITGGGYGNFNFENTLIAMSNLARFSPYNVSYPANFEQALEDFLVNTTLSLNYFLINPPISQIAGSNISSPIIHTQASATIISYPAVYICSAPTLWKIYGLSIGISILGVAAGCYMLALNGVDAQMSFSQVVVTTRNTTLDDCCYRAWRGGEYISKSLANTELKYGELMREKIVEGNQLESENHIAFGLNNEVINIDK